MQHRQAVISINIRYHSMLYSVLNEFQQRASPVHLPFECFFVFRSIAKIVRINILSLRSDPKISRHSLTISFNSESRFKQTSLYLKILRFHFPQPHIACAASVAHHPPRFPSDPGFLLIERSIKNR
ncbi:hypothetical protein [Burkholderia ubonensis]|uniref:hypothetical protein n=1 Tax=Burkholderia ubonensis TaxID=101571 RepID=UPI000A4AA268|nr:hypothetical protein [Burkholderia ubonensis]